MASWKFANGTKSLLSSICVWFRDFSVTMLCLCSYLQNKDHIHSHLPNDGRNVKVNQYALGIQ